MSTPENRFAPPKADVVDLATPTRGSTPRTVLQAVRLLWASLLLGIPGVVIYLSRTPFDAAALIGLVIQAVLFAFFAFVIVRISMGRNWARITALVLAVLGILFMLAMPEETTVIEYVLGAASSALDAVAMYLLFLSPGRVWFNPIAASEA